ncbi:6-phospho-beta-glucosidase [Kibdelosporangium banguiense]|uniref:6-phospho-beta-glucosidase n=1 Tax=Kibdelosporangium banguiense TaxID=1365924 RepID=A0ABS4TQ09_9PSEU|nr:6-phospho-beta-glucosidase [Kibdelosporangium banguiense]MBP2326491.1 6-phospho-beta-glucosidase [Kibdelosporangium banguiense]
MRLTVLGGGGFRVPLVHQALLADRAPGRVTDLVLHDLDSDRLTAIGHVLVQQANGIPDPPRITVTTDLDEAISGTDFVFSAIRVGGLAGRVADEQVALGEGVVGQETVGAGGVAYGLRTVPEAVRIARRVADLAPEAWVINFTNPAGLVTEAMSHHLGDRVIGICDSPVGLGRRVARVLGLDPDRAWFDYAGLNHLGWLRGVHVGGHDHLPRLLADSEALESFEEGKLFGADWLRTLGAIPNEYLHYYYFTRDTIAAARESRGAVLAGQQRRFYESALREPDSALTTWESARMERETTYGADSREAAGMGSRDSADLESGGYEKVALALMRAIAHDERTTLILNVRNRTTLNILDTDAVVEVPCVVDSGGPRPVVINQLPGHAAALVCAVKTVERTVIDAANNACHATAVKALALHPLVDSVTVARRILAGYLREIPQLAYLKP